MTSYVTSGDGTRDSPSDRFGEGPAVIVVGGMFCDRQDVPDRLPSMARAVRRRINYDRRGRGESGNTAPYAAAREVDDIGALIAAAGGKASVYGHSSGAELALNAAASGLPIARLVLHEPPYGPDEEDSKRSARELAESIRALLAEDRRAEAIRQFFAAYGLPPETVEGMSSDPKMLALAPTMSHDFEVMGEITRGGAIPEHLVRAINIPTLVITGGASPDFFLKTAARDRRDPAERQAHGAEGQDHEAPASIVGRTGCGVLRRPVAGRGVAGPVSSRRL